MRRGRCEKEEHEDNLGRTRPRGKQKDGWEWRVPGSLRRFLFALSQAPLSILLSHSLSSLPTHHKTTMVYAPRGGGRGGDRGGRGAFLF